jgi:hypothetical protein
MTVTLIGESVIDPVKNRNRRQDPGLQTFERRLLLKVTLEAFCIASTCEGFTSC